MRKKKLKLNNCLYCGDKLKGQNRKFCNQEHQRKYEVNQKNRGKKDPLTGQFLNGNEFWKARSSHGRHPKFKTTEELEDACLQYFEWNRDNPLYEIKAYPYKGTVVKEALPKKRAMSLSALLRFIDISHEQWRLWRKGDRPDLIGVIQWAERAIYDQKFEGAAADMLNSNIIARDLGLTEKQAHELSSKDGQPIQINVLVKRHNDNSDS